MLSPRFKFDSFTLIETLVVRKREHRQFVFADLKRSIWRPSEIETGKSGELSGGLGYEWYTLELLS